MQTFKILDLDGTLMPSHHIDNHCYWQAVDEVFQTTQGVIELHQFQNVTDNGLINEWCERTLGRPPQGAEMIALRSRFLELLEDAAEQQPESFTPFSGVTEWLAQQASHTVAIATGGWEHTARFKMTRAGLDHFSLPLASSDQGATRTAIMRHALAQLRPGGVPGPATVTYFGDGPWDLAAATVLGWNFTGIADGERAAVLRKAGAELIFTDFRPLLTH